jgi:hypothetical protein
MGKSGRKPRVARFEEEGGSSDKNGASESDGVATTLNSRPLLDRD